MNFLIFQYRHSGYMYIALKKKYNLQRPQKNRLRPKIAADSFIFGGIIGDNWLLPPIIARAVSFGSLAV